MKKAILATKVGMTQVFNEDGSLTPVTVLQAGPCVVTQVKALDKDGDAAVQVGFTDKREKLVSKPQKGMFDKAGVAYKRYIREFRFEDADKYEVKQEIKADIFAEGDKVDACGISKGKGYQGAIRRHGQHRGPMGHGTKHKRLAGALAAATYPSRVFPGNKEAGRTGRDTVTIQNVKLVKIDTDKNLMLVKGAVPGGRGGLLKIRYAVKGQDK